MPRKHSIHSRKVYVVSVNPRLEAVRWITLFLLVCALPVVAYYSAMWALGDRERTLEGRLSENIATLSQLEHTIARLEQENASLEMAGHVDQQSMEQLRTQLVRWREENEDLESNIQFYLSLMDPAASSEGVFIQSARLEPLDQENSFRYSVVLGQKATNHVRVAGTAELSVTSLVGDEPETLRLSDIADSPDDIVVGFKFFQQLEGTLYLPVDFEPDHWSVDLSLNGRSGLISATFPWPKAPAAEF